MTNKDKPKVVLTPQFQKEFIKTVPPEEREQAMSEIMEFIEKFQNNPYIGTPMWGGPFRPLVIFWNWVKRTLWGFGARW